MTITTRFAPSPTGNLHLGSMRTALYSWLFAQHFHGKFILRIENTDQKRLNHTYIDSIINSMQWLGLNWDFGPYLQTDKINHYHTVINEMISSGLAYPCYCSQERINMVRSMQIQEHKKPKYDGLCRSLLKKNKNIKNKNYVIRFANPKHGNVTFNDLIRGTVTFKNSELDDLIILRSNGMPTYNFCAVIDDYDMKITHVIRGEDHINNTPRQLNIFKALQFKPPKYAHISMILDKNKKKLSKKDKDTDIMEYRKEGILPEALLNYLVRLGWSHGNKEIFSINEMKELFNIESINKSNCIFNKSKLLWINQHYIKNMPINKLEIKMKEYFRKKNIDIKCGPNLKCIISLFKNQSKTLKEIFNQIIFFYQDSSKIDTDVLYKNFFIENKFMLEKIYEDLKKVQDWSEKNIKNIIFTIVKNFNICLKDIAMPLRILLSGRKNTSSINILIYSCGKSYTLKRIKMALGITKN
ncbi:MAG: glutamate--tRNA ligase [Wigglesworthia glossinidia]|nr:glutamate--tRNA ligase [Wigglesworthia glossinidia]